MRTIPLITESNGVLALGFHSYPQAREIAMRIVRIGLLCASVVVVATFATGCAELKTTDEKGFKYYESAPYFFVATTAECVTTSTVVALPTGEPQYITFKSGYGSSDLSAEFEGGMLKSVGQTTDNQAADTISGVAALAAAFAAKGGKAKATQCEPTALLYPILANGIDLHHPISFPVRIKP